jgi:hypothetical protein
MTTPVLMVLDDDPGSLGTLDGTLRRRYGHDYLVISEASPAAALGRLRELRTAGRPVAAVMAGAGMTAAPAAGVRWPVHAAARARGNRRAGRQQFAASDPRRRSFD